MISNCFLKYFIAEMIVSAACAVAFTTIEKPMPLWLTTIIAVTFAVLYAVERIAQLIKDPKDDRDI